MSSSIIEPVPNFSELRTRDLHGHQGSVRSLSWNVSGHRLATSSNDSTVRIWNLDRLDFKFSTELGSRSNGLVEQVIWDPTHSDRLMTVYSGKMIRFWDYRSAKPIAEIQSDYNNIYGSWSPSGRYCCVGSRDDMLSFIDAREWQIMQTFQQPCETNECCWSFSEDLLYMTTGLGTVQIIQWPSLQRVYEINAHTSNCYCIDISPDNERIAIGGADAIVTLWDTDEWICQNSITRSTYPIRSLGFSFDGRFLASGSEDRYIDIADTLTGEQIWKQPTNGPLNKLAWNPTKHVLAYAFTEPTSSGLKIFGI
ncbi:THO complex subunit Tho3 [Schizosaccharomyces osmophilus]|uniref:THO complex subunit Tho3 n=1 Tax=Schizosaccharomyces osmophilus TaxID=2545709 RepID=A0AAF0AYZ7_9SCHI|nr:THO complex subunit Tho3 [Schizosaccharomyces osmophilus]WBW75395.1 THO complex subunit Tho3 [Schizosaccharomyces osmophilus]